ncbi:MAG: nucleotide disphospho-sugar-binding domain-containing protein [Pseudomonadota bacterium]
MQILIIAIGSAGDVHPLAALGMALQRRGHDVVFLTNPQFAPLIENLGLSFVPLGTIAQYAEATTNPDLWEPRKGFTVIWQMLRDGNRIVYDRIVELVKSKRTILVGSTLAIGARLAQEKLGLSMATVHLSPSCILSSYRPPVFKGLWLPASLPLFVKQGVWWLIERGMIDRVCADDLNRLRAELELPPVTRVMGKWIHSPDLVLGLFSEWFGQPQPDWPANFHVTGFPLFDEAVQTSSKLEMFLDTEPPPIVFTPGSAMRFATPFFNNAIEACRRLGRRGLLLTTYTEQLPALPAFIHHENYVPLGNVLPRSAAFVYHGGIGSCAQALAAGIPHMVVPYAHDQFDNASRLRELGVGLSVSHSDGADSFTESLRHLIESPAVIASCQKLREQMMNRSDVLGKTCLLIENLETVDKRN